MFGGMDWQQGLALLIVGVTAAIFAWARFRPRKFSFTKDTHCGGCNPSANAAQLGGQQSIHFRARKGERPRVIVKNQ